MDFSSASDADSFVNLYWDLTLSDPEWANHLSTTSYGIFDEGSSSNPPYYNHTFTSKNPSGEASGTYYTDVSAQTPTLADVADFEVTMYSDGLGITLTRGALPRADAVFLDFYKYESSSTALAELALSSTELAGFATSATIIVKPDTLSDVYTDNSVKTYSSGWYVEYYTFDSPDASLADRTEYIYLSYSDETVNSIGTAAPTGYPTFPITTSASVQAPRALPVAALFRGAKEGVRPYLRHNPLRE